MAYLLINRCVILSFILGKIESMQALYPAFGGYTLASSEHITESLKTLWIVQEYFLADSSLSKLAIFPSEEVNPNTLNFLLRSLTSGVIDFVVLRNVALPSS